MATARNWDYISSGELHSSDESWFLVEYIVTIMEFTEKGVNLRYYTSLHSDGKLTLSIYNTNWQYWMVKREILNL